MSVPRSSDSLFSQLNTATAKFLQQLHLYFECACVLWERKNIVNVSGPFNFLTHRAFYALMRLMLDWSSVCCRSPCWQWRTFLWFDLILCEFEQKGCVYKKNTKNWKPAGVVCVCLFVLVWFGFVPLTCARVPFCILTKGFQNFF